MRNIIITFINRIIIIEKRKSINIYIYIDTYLDGDLKTSEHTSGRKE